MQLLGKSPPAIRPLKRISDLVGRLNQIKPVAQFSNEHVSPKPQFLHLKDSFVPQTVDFKSKFLEFQLQRCGIMTSTETIKTLVKTSTLRPVLVASSGNTIFSNLLQKLGLLSKILGKLIQLDQATTAALAKGFRIELGISPR